MPFLYGLILLVFLACLCYAAHVSVRKRDLTATKRMLMDRKAELNYKLTKCENDYVVHKFIEGEITEIDKDIAILDERYADNYFEMIKKDIVRWIKNLRKDS